jgi:hypothetical protein
MFSCDVIMGDDNALVFLFFLITNSLISFVPHPSLWANARDTLSERIGKYTGSAALIVEYVKWCCYITVNSATTALQNGACTHWCISKQMIYKTTFSHIGYMKSLEFYENYITLFFLEKTNFLAVLY